MEVKLRGTGYLTRLKEKYFIVVTSSLINENKEESEIASNEDPGHHLVVDFSSDLAQGH